MGATNAPGASYCDKNPMVCVGLGAVAIGGVTAAIIHATKDDDKAPASAPAGGRGSDMRLKRDIVLLAVLDDGLRIYAFRYLWSNDVHVGVMAQEILADPVRSTAVYRMQNGFYGVDYTALGIRMATLVEWIEGGISSLKLMPSEAHAVSDRKTLACAGEGGVVCAGRNETVYNLGVSGTKTYFVGRGKAWVGTELQQAVAP